MPTKNIKKRLEYLRGELQAERISYGELHELQSLADHIDKDDVELLQAAGVPEFDEDEESEGEHVHRWGPVEHARFTGNPHRKCQYPGCREMTMDLSDEDDDSCPECSRSYGPNYSGPCEHN